MDAASVNRAVPVVVIHGALRSRMGLWPVVRFLENRGFQAARVHGPGSGL